MNMEAPWTKEQVDSLRGYQASGLHHPFTSAGGAVLIPTEHGWVEREGGPVVQTWAHQFMLDESWKVFESEDPLVAAVLAARKEPR